MILAARMILMKDYCWYCLGRIAEPSIDRDISHGTTNRKFTNADYGAAVILLCACR